MMAVTTDAAWVARTAHKTVAWRQESKEGKARGNKKKIRRIRHVHE